MRATRDVKALITRETRKSGPFTLTIDGSFVATGVDAGHLTFEAYRLGANIVRCEYDLATWEEEQCDRMIAAIFGIVISRRCEWPTRLVE